MTNTLIVPGLDVPAAPRWKHWRWATEGSALMADLSFPNRPRPAIWEMELALAILQYPDSILVGHSPGAVLITRLFNAWPHLPVRDALLMAPSKTAGNDRICHFGLIPEVPFVIPTALVASRNDPWMGFGRATQPTRTHDRTPVNLGQAGHINTASGFGDWSEGKRLRDRLLNRQQTDHQSFRSAGPA